MNWSDESNDKLNSFDIFVVFVRCREDKLIVSTRVVLIMKREGRGVMVSGFFAGRQ